ncbi:MAG: M28 family peptidase [Bacteroidia bacterium]|nr:M28 family peptidase [Bacteroidia bacterium]
MRTRLYIIGLACLGFVGCTNGNDPHQPKNPPPKPPAKKTISVDFNADSAYRYVAEQVAFGPRVPGTAAHGNTLIYLRKQLARFCDTAYILNGTHTDVNGNLRVVNNVMGSFNPSSKKRVILAAHWDTRPQADEDSVHFTTPADGANDGASGVGVLIEMARQFKKLKPEFGVDIIFFDQEDGGESGGHPNTWCIGSQYWSDQALNQGYEAQYGILLDMVGAKGATFAHELNSVHFNHSLVLETWKTGQQLGYSSYFLNVRGNLITDDHVFMKEYAGIPTIDIIHYDLNTFNRFPDHWHRQTDNMDVIDKNTLKAVGHTVLHVVMNRG